MPNSYNNIWALPTSLAEEILRSFYDNKKASNENGASAFQRNSEKKQEYSINNGIAIIEITGPIYRKNIYSWWSDERIAIGHNSIKKDIQSAIDNPSVKQILLSINSPGGVVSGTKELADFIAHSPKPISAYADGLVASAAFWLASATGIIYAPATAMLGSIGVIQVHVDLSKYYERVGVKFTPITAGTFKAVGSDSSPLSEEDKKYLQKQLDSIHTIFKNDVQSNLGLTSPQNLWGEAQIMLANEAKELGLVSAVVQDINEVIDILSKENIMDKATLSAQHPDLLAEIQNEAKAEMVEQAQTERKALFAVIEACCGKEAINAVNATIQKCTDAKLDAEQITALAPSLAVKVEAQTSPSQATSEEQAKAQILAGLQTTSPVAVEVDPKDASALQKSKSSLVANAEKRAQAK